MFIQKYDSNYWFIKKKLFANRDLYIIKKKKAWYLEIYKKKN